MENIKIGLQIDSNTKSETADAKKLHDQLKQAADAAGKIKVGGVAKAAAQPAGAMASAQPTGSQAIQQYGAMRGTAGQTGASARDFANQAQGLSGLVRLYAIYAANVYAVGAAFGALSRAMDTSNMVRGLDQIGAASGVALGGLSKQLVTATGGAISLRDAMSATVKVTAAGLGSENVLRLGQVAAKASQALGVDMGDAINRLSRGITKLEPELLDELGIFTKIDPAVQKYALSVGKSAAQLTDFERRQAFANAVLEEGEKKFAAIKVDANPYNKLAASLQNIAQNGLELVNKVLAPIVNLLSSNPTALVLALTGIASTIIKQAVPAFGLFRQNIQKANEEANKATQARANFAISTQQDLNKKLLNLVEARADKESEILDTAEKKFQALKARGVKVSPTVQKVLEAPSVLDITDKQVASVERAASAAKKRGLTEEAKVYDEIATSIKNGRKAEEEYLKTKRDATDSLINDVKSKRTIIGLNAALAESAEKASFKQQITSNAAYAGSLIGPINAIKLMRAELNASDIRLNMLSKTMVLAKGGLYAFAGAAATVGAALSAAFAVIAALIGVGTILVTLFTNTRKEAEANSQAFGQLEESTKNLTNSIDVLNKKPYLEQFNAESVNAKANALEGFNTALQKANQAAQAELSAMNWLDKSVDVVKMLWGGDVQSKLNKETAYGLSKAFSSAQISGSEAGKVARDSIANLLKIDPSQVGDLNKVEEALGRLSKSEAAAALAAINAQVENLSKSNRASAVALSGLEEGFKKIDETRKRFTQEFIPQDSFSQFGSALVSTSFELEAALKNPTTQLQAIKRTFEELKSIGGISPDLLIGLQDVAKKSEELQVLTASLQETEVRSEQLKLKQKELQAQIDSKSLSGRRWKEVNAELEQVTQSLADLDKYKSTTLNVKLNLQQSIDASQKVINEAQVRVFETGSQIVASKLSAEFAKAGQTITGGFASLLSGTETGIKLRAQAEKQMLAVQAAQIKAQEQQIRATAENTVALKQKTISDKQEQLKTAAVDDAAILGREITTLRDEVGSLQKALAPGGSYAKLAEQRSQEMRATGKSGVTGEALNLASSLQGSQAALANIGAQGYVVELNLQKDLREFAEKAGVAEKQREIERLKAARELITVNGEVFNQTNETALAQRQQLDTLIRQKEEALRQSDAVARVNALEFVKTELAKSSLKNKDELLKNLSKEISLVEQIAGESTTTAQLKEQVQQQKDILERIQLRGRVELEQFDRESRNSQQRLEARSLELDVQQKSFDILSRTIQLSPEFVAAEEEILTRKRAQLEFDKQRQQLDQARQRGLLDLGQQEQTVLAGATGEDGLTESEVARLAEIETKRKQINTEYAAGIAQQTAILTLAEREAVAKKAIADEQNRYNLLLSQTQSVGESLKGIFESLGTSADKFAQGISSFVSSFTELGIQTEKNLKAITNFEQALANPEISPEERAKAETELGKAKQKQTKDELAGNIKLVSSAKNLFKEKSTGYKILNAIEKAMHIAKLAMMVKEMFFDTANTAKSVANSATRGSASIVEAGIDGVKAVVKAISSLPPPWSYVAGAATAAVVGGLLSQIGGSKPSVNGGGGAISAEQRQETQGTAMGYNAQGEKVRVREGVFGDTSAKSESIANSLEIIKDNSVKGLDYDDKLLKSFEKLAKSIETAAGALYSTRGITIGSAFDTQEGTRGTSFLGISLSKTTTAIIDSGIRLSGSFLDLANKTGGVIEGFETVQTTRKRLIGKTKTSVDTQGFGLDTATVRAIEDSFASAADIIYELGGEIGIGVNNITNALQNVPVNELVSLRGLKGKELQEQLQAVLGSVIDEAAFKVFGTLATTYRKFGEGALETVVRVVDTNRKIEQQLGNIRGTGTALELGFEVTEALADAAGGLQSFIEKTDGFIDKFLTDAEKLVPTQLAVSRGLDKLGLGWVKTKDQFKQVAQSLDVTTDYGRETFVALMNISEGFDEVATAAEKAFESVKNELKSVAEQRISELKGARDEMQGFAKSLREYQSSLKTGSLSPLTPQQQYEELKREFLTTQQRAMGGDAVAMAKLSAAGSSFLQASQRMFASSDEYVSDFDLVSSSIDSAASFAEQQVGIANQTLAEIKNVVGALVELKVETEKVPVALSGFGTALSEALAKYTISKAAMGAAFETGGIRKYALGGVVTQMTPFQHATGLGVMGEAGPEAIMPLKRMPGGELGVTMGGNFGEQLAKLNQQVAELTQVVANGAVMNAQATDRNTDAVVAAVGNTAETMEYKNKLTSRMQIV